MKTLQNNFTTPEQSKRLLELGVPTDSADCYWTEFPLYEGKFHGYEHKPQWLYDDEKFSKLQSYCKTRILPCWSVGRLMEILDICELRIHPDTSAEEYPSTATIMDKLSISYVEFLVRTIQIAKKARVLDFSELEE